MTHIVNHCAIDYGVHMFFVESKGHEKIVGDIESFGWELNAAKHAPCVNDDDFPREGVWYNQSIDNGWEWWFIGRDHEAVMFKLRY